MINAHWFHKHQNKWICLLLFLLAFGVRLAYVIEYANEIGIDYYRFDQTDNNTFHLWAKKIAEGDVLCRNQIHPYHIWTSKVAPEGKWERWYKGKAVYHQSPLYPYLVGGLYALFGEDVRHIRVFQALLSAFTAIFVFLIARRYFGIQAGLIAGLIFVFCGFHYFYIVFVLREGLITFLLSAFLYFTIEALERKSMWRLIMSGSLIGFSIAAKPNACLLIIVHAMAIFVYFKNTVKLKTSVLFLFILLPLLPFFLRNAILEVPAFKLTTRGPAAFINGNLRGQSGVEWKPPIEETRAILCESDYNFTGVIQGTLSSYIDNPLAWPDLVWNKAKAYFNSYEIPNNTNYYLIKGASNLLSVGFVTFWFLSPAALIGMLLLMPKSRQVWPLYLTTFLVISSVIAFFIVSRFRQPMVPIFSIFAGYAVYWFLKKLFLRRILPLIPIALIFWGLLSWTDNNKQTYATQESVYNGIMVKLAIQEDFQGAVKYKDLFLNQMENKFSTDAYQPYMDSRRDLLSKAFKEFDWASHYPPENGLRYLFRAKGYYQLLKTSKRMQFEFLFACIQKNIAKAFDLNPQIKNAHKLLGLARLEYLNQKPNPDRREEKLKEAYTHFLYELERNPNDLDTLKALGFCSFVFGKMTDARKYYETYLRKCDPWDFNIASQLSLIYLQCENSKNKLLDAVRLAEDAYNQDPRNVKFCENYSLALFAADRVDDSIKILKKLTELDFCAAASYQKRIGLYLKIADQRKSKRSIQN